MDRAHRRRFLWLGLVLVFAATGWANAQLPLGWAAPAPTPTPLMLPVASGVQLRPGRDADLVAANCTLCHTFKPIVTHDGFTPEQWAAEVQKMRELYGAPVDEATAARITTYLQTYYASPPPSAADFLLGVATRAAATPPAASPAPSAGACPAGATAPCLTIAMRDIYFTPNVATLPANTPVTIVLPNQGVIVHNFSVTSRGNAGLPNLNISVDVAPGATKTVAFKAPAGTYYFFCDQPGHEAAGMRGYLEVKPGATISGATQTVTPPAG
jgi:plastocyanin